ncbi:helix-turn-helix transcriptional regulator [Thermomonospora echinospora]|nr:LuxR family transcriptional regulator [Thermomonospora echinospora]
MERCVVGRARELEALQDLCAAAIGGAGTVALLLGEAGIGKSALVEELAGYAAKQGVPVAVGRAVADEGAPAFWPWLRVLDQARRDGLPGLPASLLDLRRTTDGEPVVAEPTAVARFRAVAATVGALASAAEPAGLVVVLENLQWADESSLRLLRHLCDEKNGARLLVLGTVRDPDGGRHLPQTLMEIAGLPTVHSLRLGPLGIPDIATYLRRSQEPFDSSWPRRIHRLVGGNPLFVRELTRLLARQGRLARPAGETDRIELPVELHRLMAMRTAHLGADCCTLLDACAAIGEEIDVELLRAAFGAQVESAVAEAIASGLLIDDPHAPSTIRFAHELIRQARYAQLSRTERIGWHQRIADALAAAGPNEDRPGELARHRVRAAVDAPSRRAAVRACRDAGDAAARRLDFAATERWCRHALDLLGGEDPPLRARLLLAAAQACYLDGQVTTALDDCAQVADIAERLGLADLAAEAALVVRGFAGLAGPAITALCERARALLGEENSPRHAAVLAQHATILAESARTDEAEAVSRQAMAMAEDNGDHAALIHALNARLQVIASPDQAGERLALGSRMQQLAGRCGRPDGALWGLVWRIPTQFQLGALEGADGDIAELAEVVDRLGTPVGRWHLLRLRATRALLAGDFTQARSDAMAARQVADAIQDPTAIAMHSAFMAGLLHFTGGIAEYIDELEAGLATLPAQYSAVKTAVMSMAYLDAGDHDQARICFSRLRSRIADAPRIHSWDHMAVLSAEVAVALADTDTTGTCYHLLEPYAGYHTLYGSFDRALGLLASARGEHDLADRHLTAAVAMEERTGAPTTLAFAQLSHAQALAARAGQGNRARALALAGNAARTARRLGMAPIAATASTLVDELTGVRAGVAALTAREREVAGFVAQGLVNKAIAEHLVVSERTVETHVRNLLAKLGLTNRTQVAAWAARAGLHPHSH